MTYTASRYLSATVGATIGLGKLGRLVLASPRFEPSIKVLAMLPVRCPAYLAMVPIR